MMSGNLRCSVCGGSGLGLVRKDNMCLHCTRKRNAQVLKPPGIMEIQLEAGFIDISPEGNFGIMKRVLKAGSCEHVGIPQEGCPTTFHFVSRTWDEEIKKWDGIFESSRDIVDGKHSGGTDDPREIILGRFNEDTMEDDLRKEALDPNHIVVGRCKAWDFALFTMAKGEIAQFACTPAWAYSLEGYPPKVPANAYVMFEFELISWDRQLPPMPTRAQMEQSRIEREEEDRRKYEENPPPSFQERLESSAKEKDRGNELFQKGEYASAKKAYDSAFVHIFYSIDEYNWHLGDEERNELDSCKLVLHLNRAMTKLKLNLAEECLWDCEKALEIDPTNAKGLYRRCCARCEQLVLEMAKEDEGQFWVLEKAWEFLKLAKEDLRQLIDMMTKSDSKVGGMDGSIVAARKRMKSLEEKLLEYTKKYRDQEKSLFKNKIWDKVEKENAGERNREKQQQAEERRMKEEEELADMPSLE